MGSSEDRVLAVGEAFAAAGRDNPEANVTAALAIDASHLVQVIEGPEPAVQASLERITRDDRYRNVRVAFREDCTERLFAGHPMVLVGRSPQGRRALLDLAERSSGTLAFAEPRLLLDTFRRIVVEEADDTTEKAAPLDTDRLRAELEEVGLTPPRGPAENEAIDAVLAVAVFSAEGLVLRANANLCSLFGQTPDALGRLSHSDLIAPGEDDRVRDLWDAMRRGETVTLEHGVLRPDSTDAWLSSTFRPRRDDAGHLLDVVQIAVDHTERQGRQAADRSKVVAIESSQAVVQFDLDGIILDANGCFLDTAGYTLREILGRHHDVLVAGVAAGPGETLWADLRKEGHPPGEFRRVGKDGRPFWLHGMFSPVLGPDGGLRGMTQVAAVVTAAKLARADSEGQIAAIHKSLAVITFDLAGVILDANAIFLDAVGYARDEVVGRHHRMFVDPSYAHGAEYAAFWRRLAHGKHKAGQYKRIGQGGREVWLQATYNPVFDMDGQPFKVVAFATIVTEERLLQAEHQGQIAAIHKGQCVISFDLDGTILDANDNFLQAMGYRLRDVRGRHHRMFVQPDEAASTGYAEFWAGLAAGRFNVGEFKRLGRDGREIWLQATYNPIFDMSGRPFRIVKYATDITAEKLLRADFEGQIDAIRKSQGVVAFALDGTILDVNDNMLQTLGYTLPELQGCHHAVLIEPDHRGTPEYESFWEELQRGTFSSGLYKRVRKDGQHVWIQATYNPILDLNGRPAKIIKFASDVTSQVALAEAYEDAKRQAQHDSATALPNRVRLASFMTSVLAEPDARLVVLYIDLDRFKPINDMFGHAVGDRVLGEAADRLRRSLSGDQLVARVGGDEFVVVAPDLKDEDIEPFCQRLIAAMSVPVRHEGGDLQVSMSIGIAVSPTDGRAPDDLLRCADAALYRSKQSGRGTYSFYSGAMNDRILFYRTAVEDMRRAIEAGEFFLEYQPRVESRSRRIQSVEALVRWQHPTRGRVSPGDFIVLAERSGLILQLGAWVLRTACRAARGWDGIGVSVNVSPVQFRSGELPDLVRTVLREEGLAPERLELEITEGVLLENADLARQSLDEIKRLGVKLAMDDFGTGYSSLSTLRNFPFDVIKIDRQFIADLDDGRGGRDVVRAILGLGKALGLSVTAEGVETDRQLKWLTADDCDEVQGYLLGRPTSEADVTGMLHPQRCPDTLEDAPLADAPAQRRA